MSELVNIRKTQAVRHQLLATVSALTLACCAAPQAIAASTASDRPTVWIELGGQLERMSNSQEPFAPDFTATHLGAAYNAESPLNLQKLPRYGFGGEGKISFEPEGSNWIFSAAVRYGRANAARHTHQQTTFIARYENFFHPSQPIYRPHNRFDDTVSDHRESQTVLDFMAGKDVGLGMLGRGAVSTFSAGVRIAQFSTKSSVTLKSFPDPAYPPDKYHKSQAHHHSYYGHLQADRTFRGVGPSVSWSGYTPFVGNTDAGEMTFDWGVNAAVLFGRNKADGTHRTTGRYFMGSPYALPPPPTSHYARTAPFNRARTLIVPNAGGFAGLSLRYPNAKVSLGYRADFFGAMDGGIDSRKSVTPGFYGPFATIAIGLGG